MNKIKELENKVKNEIDELETAFIGKSFVTQVSLRGSIGALEDVLRWIQELGE